jgi:hypothetical protein
MNLTTEYISEVAGDLARGEAQNAFVGTATRTAATAARLAGRTIPPMALVLNTYYLAPFAYSLASVGYEKLTGGNLDDTYLGKAANAVGSAVNTTIDTSMDYAFKGVSGMLGAVGFNTASEYTKDARNWYFQDENGEPTLPDQTTSRFKLAPEREASQYNLQRMKMYDTMTDHDQNALQKATAGRITSGRTLSFAEALNRKQPIAYETTLEEAQQSRSNTLTNLHSFKELSQARQVGLAQQTLEPVSQRNSRSNGVEF